MLLITEIEIIPGLQLYVVVNDNNNIIVVHMSNLHSENVDVLGPVFYPECQSVCVIMPTLCHSLWCQTFGTTMTVIKMARAQIWDQASCFLHPLNNVICNLTSKQQGWIDPKTAA